MAGLKWREEVPAWELSAATILMLLAIIGASVTMAGVAELPKCKYGDPRCYFFVKICDADLLPVTANVTRNIKGQYCQYVPKNRKTQGGTEDGLEQAVIPLVAAALGVIPGMVLTFATLIKNERCLFNMLDIGKMFIVFDLILLVLGGQRMSTLTWDCRWYGDEHHPDQDKCTGAYDKFVVGIVFVFISEFIILCGLVMWSEIERRRIGQDRAWFSDGFSVEANNDSQAVGMSNRSAPNMNNNAPGAWGSNDGIGS